MAQIIGILGQTVALQRPKVFGPRIVEETASTNEQPNQQPRQEPRPKFERTDVLELSETAGKSEEDLLTPNGTFPDNLSPLFKQTHAILYANSQRLLNEFRAERRNEALRRSDDEHIDLVA